MSKETSERGELKREEIRKLIYKLRCECISSKQTPEEIVKTLNKHAYIMKKGKPQEGCLVDQVMSEVHRDPEGFSQRQKEKMKK